MDLKMTEIIDRFKLEIGYGICEECKKMFKLFRFGTRVLGERKEVR